MDQACRKILASLSNRMNPYTQLWHVQERSTDTQDTVTQNPTQVPGSVQDMQMLQDPT